MKKKWSTIIATVLATVMLVTASVPALAESENVSAADAEPTVRVRQGQTVKIPRKADPTVRARQGQAVKSRGTEPPVIERHGLTIEAPRRAEPGETVTITVSERGSGDAVKDAAVWALSRQNAEALQAQIAGHKQLLEATDNGTPPERVDFEALVRVYGTFLGNTNGAGKVQYAFEEDSFYLLVALKPGYLPGRTGIAIKGMPQALAIEAPRRADPDETVTMTVTEKGSDKGVKDAAVWALTRENAEALRAEIEEIKSAGTDAAIDQEGLVSRYGFFLGNTNGAGKLQYAFEEEGFYLLVALKPGYLPGRTGIAIKTIPQGLAIQSPRKAEVGEEVTMTVVQRGGEKPVPDVAVWALKLDLESLENVPGTFLGNTNENGELSYSFREAGLYLLLAKKTGYLPGLSPIVVGRVNIPGVTLETAATPN